MLIENDIKDFSENLATLLLFSYLLYRFKNILALQPLLKSPSNFMFFNKVLKVKLAGVMKTKIHNKHI